MKKIYLRLSSSAAALSLAAALTLALVPGVTVPQQAMSGMTDANIAAIVVAANAIDIDYGKIALAKSKNQSVREFAQRMITDHSAVLKSATELVTRLGVTPVDDATSTGLKTGAEPVKTRLKGLSRKAFDRAYIDNEVEYHKVVVDAVKETLIPNARNAELKAMLVGVLPLFQKHLEHAQQVQTNFNRVKGAKDDHKMGMSH